MLLFPRFFQTQDSMIALARTKSPEWNHFHRPRENDTENTTVYNANDTVVDSTPGVVDDDVDLHDDRENITKKGKKSLKSSKRHVFNIIGPTYPGLYQLQCYLVPNCSFLSSRNISVLVSRVSLGHHLLVAISIPRPEGS